MERKQRRSEIRRGEVPVLIIPRQTHDAIVKRQRIRESLHDAKAVTIKSQRSRPKPRKAR